MITGRMWVLQVINHDHFDGFCYITRDKCLLAFSLDNSTYIKNLINHLVVVVVVVRDLFYNQPVRRKYMQSSPKKVLHCVNKCVHRIALVHSNVSFKVVDIESEDELLRTTPSPSPLILLKRTFGTEISNALHELNISDGRLKLSGYISTPCNNLADKAFQYVCIHVHILENIYQVIEGVC
ncbi:DNA mismatch repair protein MLH3-like isoform X3 [Malus domestica]|uniref:DNA mismatch repair protein MLH3-like isoform X3 n=1 Tax=Malus domestica TaxID=3750 RepID=UPI0039758932